MSNHSQASLGARHPPHNYEYADATARTGATGFVAADVGKQAKQLDDNTLWALTATAPTWKQVDGGGGGAHDLGGGDHNADTLANLNTKISDATLDDAGDSRPPSGAAGGDLSGTYPNPTVTNVSLSVFEDGSIVDTTDTSNTDVAISDCVLSSPGAGSYFVAFSCSLENSEGNEDVHISIYANGVQIANSERVIDIGVGGAGADTPKPVSTYARVSGLSGGQDIEARVRTSGGTVTLHRRNIIAVRTAAT